MALWAVSGSILALIAMAVRATHENRTNRPTHTGAHVMPRTTTHAGHLTASTEDSVRPAAVVVPRDARA